MYSEAIYATVQEHPLQRQGLEKGDDYVVSHSCIHDQIIEQRKRPGRQVYSVTPQVYEVSGVSMPSHHRGRALLGISEPSTLSKDVKKPIRIYLNYDAVGHSSDRDCQNVGDIVKASVQFVFIFYWNGKYQCVPSPLIRFLFSGSSYQLGEPPGASFDGEPSCNPHGDPPLYGDCWYNCTLEDIDGEDKKHRLRKVLF